MGRASVYVTLCVALVFSTAVADVVQAPLKDCILQPLLHQCSCQEKLGQCLEERNNCDMIMAYYQKKIPQYMKDAAESAYAHPLMNTLAIKSTVMKHSFARAKPARQTCSMFEHRAMKACFSYYSACKQTTDRLKSRLDQYKATLDFATKNPMSPP